MDDCWHVSTPAKAGHRPSSWYKFGGSGLPLRHFEVWHVTKETQSSFTDDVGDAEQARTMQNLIVRHKIVQADVQDASLAP